MIPLPHYKKVISTDPDVLAFAEIFKDFKLEYIEQSVKITQGSINKDRALFAIRGHNIKFSKLHDILIKLNFPKSHLADIESMYYANPNIGFAIEKSTDSINYRIYFEKNLHESKWQELMNKMYYYYPLIQSYKWNYDDGDLNCSTYETVLTPNGKEASLQIRSTGTSFIPECISEKLKSIWDKANSIGIFIVSDSATRRKAADLNFGTDVLYNRDLSQDLHRFSKKNLSHTLAAYDEKQIHHVSVGMGKNDEPYVTLYYLIHDPDRGI
jgi:hypothetical protein